jgi:hypothetical protein
VRKNLIGSAEKINKLGDSTHKISKRSHEGMVDGQTLARVEPAVEKPITAYRKIPNGGAHACDASCPISAEEKLAAAALAGLQKLSRLRFHTSDRWRQELRQDWSGEGLDGSDFAAQGDSIEKQSVIAREGHVRKHVFQILRETQGARGRRQQSEDRIKRVLRIDWCAVVCGESGEQA